MEKLFNTVSIIIGLAGGFMVKIFGGFDKVMCVLMGMMVLDYISGLVKAIHQKELSSEIGYKGLLKKIVILIVVAAANMVQQIISDSIPIREIVIMFYVANEGISILENATSVTDIIPEKFKEVLLQLRQGNSKE